MHGVIGRMWKTLVVIRLPAGTPSLLPPGEPRVEGRQERERRGPAVQGAMSPSLGACPETRRLRTTGGGRGCLLVLVVLLLGLVLLCAGGDLGILLCKDAYDSSGDLVVDDGDLIIAKDVIPEFLQVV